MRLDGRRRAAQAERSHGTGGIELDQEVCGQSISESAATLEKTVKKLSTESTLKTLLLRGEYMREANVSVLEHFCTVKFV